jgi:Domain of unknown function (DUF1905)
MAVIFTATLKAGGGVFFEVPPEIMATLDGGKRPAVPVVINGVLVRTTIAVYGGRSYIGVRREIRDAAKRRETREQRVAEAPVLLKRGRRTPLSSR